MNDTQLILSWFFIGVAAGSVLMVIPLKTALAEQYQEGYNDGMNIEEKEVSIKTTNNEEVVYNLTLVPYTWTIDEHTGNCYSIPASTYRTSTKSYPMHLFLPDAPENEIMLIDNGKNLVSGENCIISNIECRLVLWASASDTTNITVRLTEKEFPEYIDKDNKFINDKMDFANDIVVLSTKNCVAKIERVI